MILTFLKERRERERERERYGEEEEDEIVMADVCHLAMLTGRWETERRDRLMV